jgi:hypothetical protein
MAPHVARYLQLIHVVKQRILQRPRAHHNRFEHHDLTDGAVMINICSARGMSRLAAIAVLATCVPVNRAAPPRYQIAFTSFAPFDVELFVADSDGSNATPGHGDGVRELMGTEFVSSWGRSS